MCIPHAGTPVNSAFNRRIEVRKRELDLPQDKLHDLQANLRKISNRRRPNLITKGFYLQCRRKNGLYLSRSDNYTKKSNKKTVHSQIQE